MDLHRLGRAAVFVAGSIVGGLALAFVIVVIHPQLLQRPAATPTPPAVVEAPPPSRSAGTVATGLDAETHAGAEWPQASARATERGLASGAAATPYVTESYAAAVKRAAPAVVNISTERVVTEQVQPSVFDQLFGDLQPFYRHRVERALGSGVIVDGVGHIITNNHVVANADTIMVVLADGRSARASVVGRDPDTDLALLSIKLKNLPVMPLGRSDELQVGDQVLAIGDPLGLSQTVTHGIVSATGRSQLGVATFESFIQTDAAINAGNSGGALINVRGELVGINTAVLNKARGNISVEGIGFAIPVNLARGVMGEILDHGHVIRGWVGLLPEDVDDEQAKELGLSGGAVLIANMYRNSPAVSAGLQLGDIITAVDRKPVHSAQEALSQIAAKRPGASVLLHVLRGHTALDTAVTVTERPTSIQGT